MEPLTFVSNPRDFQFQVCFNTFNMVFGNDLGDPVRVDLSVK